MKTNYIQRLQDENARLCSALKTWDDSAGSFRAFLGSEKFTGTATDGSRKDWIATADVVNWLRDLQNTVATEANK